MLNRKVDGILIDLDGTLIDSHPALFSAYSKFLLLQGKVASEEEFRELSGIPIFEILPLLIKKHELHLPFEELKWVLQSFIEEEYLDSTLMKGARDFLEFAHDAGIPLALVTSSRSEWVLPILEKQEARSYFKTIVTRERVPVGKPAPDPFLLGVKELGVDPRKSYAIEDAELGIQSAKAAGLNILRFVPAPPYPEDAGDWPTLQARVAALLK